MTIVVQHLSGSKQGMTEQFHSNSLTIGRDPTNDLAFDPSIDLDVSSRHAQLNLMPGGMFQLVDLGSTNGTFVNGQKVQGATTVMNGSMVEFGKNGVKVIFRWQEDAPQPAYAAAPIMPQAVPGAAPQKGARTKMFEQALEQSKGEAKSTKKLMCCSIVGFLLLIVGIVGGFFYVKIEENRSRAEKALEAALEAKKDAELAKAVDYSESKGLFDEADGQVKQGEELLVAWDFEEAESLFGKAGKNYDRAREEAKSAQKEAAYQAQMDEVRNRAAQAEAEKESIAASARAEEVRIIEEAKASGDQTKIEEANTRAAAIREDAARKIEEVQAKSDKELANGAAWVVCRVRSQAWIYDGERQVQKLTDEIVGTGVFIQGNKLLTSKQIAKPHFYDETAKATTDFYKAKSPNFQDRVVIHVEVFAPDAADQGITSKWMKLFSTDNSSIVPAKFGHEDPSEYNEGKELKVMINKQSETVKNVKTLKDNLNNWATFDVNLDRAFPNSPEGRAAKAKIHGELGFVWCPVSKGAPAPADDVLVFAVVGDAIKINKESAQGTPVQGGVDPFEMDESFNANMCGAPVFNSKGEVIGLVVRQSKTREIEAIAASNIKP